MTQKYSLPGFHVHLSAGLTDAFGALAFCLFLFGVAMLLTYILL
jgi:hypothetical protein